MFFQGNIQSGIELAIRESKIVACFVRDATEESSTWEDEYLKDNGVATLLRSRAILLRIEANSQEATLLSAFCPIAKVPTLVAIYDGQLRANLTAGITKERFVEGLKTVLQAQLGPEVARLPTAGDSALSPTTTPAAESPTTLTSTVEHDSQEAQSPTVQALLAERRTRLEAQKKAQDAAEKQERVAKAKARREAAQAAGATNTAPGSARARDASYAQQQRKRQLEARQERERILKLVENDKAERREREERRKATIGTSKTPASWGPGVPDTREAKQVTPTSERECAIQVRLLDGSTIRARFPSSATFRGAIRPWIDQQRSDGDTPYTIKQILAPSPNRAITISEEEENLQALGLAPSATLVLVPIRGYINAYQTGTGLLSGAVSTGYSLLSSGAGLVAGALGTFLGVGRPVVPQDDDVSSGWNTPGRPDPQDQSSSEAANSRPSGNIKTLRDHEVDGNDRQFYNGNQLNFEPNRDDDEKED